MRAVSRLIAGQWFEIWVDDTVPQPDVIWLLDYLSQLFTDVPIPVDPEFIRIGMMFVKAVPTNGRLVLWEPDMIHMPIVFKLGVTNALHIWRIQTDALKSIESEHAPLFPDIFQFLLQCNKWGDSMTYIVERDEPKDNDSGWYIGCQDYEHDHQNPDNLSLTSVYEFSIHHSEIVPFLAFPGGATILVENDRPFVYIDGNEKIPRADSYLRDYIYRTWVAKHGE